MRSEPTLDELVADPSKVALLSSVKRASLVGRCAAVLAALSGAMLTGERPDTDLVPRTAPDRLITVQEAAELMGFAASYVYEMVRRGDLPAVRPRGGKYVRLRRAAVEQWIAANERDGVDAPLNTMLSRSSEPGRSTTPPASVGVDPGRPRQRTGRARHHRVSLGNGDRGHSGADGTPAGLAGSEPGEAEA